MISFAVRCLTVLGIAAAATLLTGMSGPGPGGHRPAAADGPPAARTLDGFVLHHLPPGLGTLVSDFDYEWGDVRQQMRVWESGPDAAGEHRADLRVAVLRGDRLTDPQALRTFIAEYLERGPDWNPQPYEQQHGYRGFAEPGRVFFLVRPGVAVQVAADQSDRVSQEQMLATADGIAPA